MKYLLFFILASILGIYLVTRPAMAAIPLEGSLTIDAENMTFVGTGTNRATPGGWNLLGEGAMVEDVIFKADKHDFEIIAKGENYEGWPNLELKIGSVVVANITVDSATWKTFSIDNVVGIAPGTHQLSMAFTNDNYGGTSETDRNLQIDKIQISEILGVGKVTLAWDANVEPDLAGYKIYYGSKTRAEITDGITKWCTAHEPNNEKCIEEWEAICDQDGTVDPACHSMLFGYDVIVDCKNVTEFTIVGLEEGRKYYFAATAYDEDDNESAFSKELSHSVAYQMPGGGHGFTYKDVVKWLQW
jgi:hypothetical protein